MGSERAARVFVLIARLSGERVTSINKRTNIIESFNTWKWIYFDFIWFDLSIVGFMVGKLWNFNSFCLFCYLLFKTYIAVSTIYLLILKFRGNMPRKHACEKGRNSPFYNVIFEWSIKIKRIRFFHMHKDTQTLDRHLWFTNACHTQGSISKRTTRKINIKYFI